MSTAAQRGWGMPCSQPIVTARWVQPRGTAIAIPVHRDIVRLVMALVNRLGTARGRDIAQYGTWGYACRYISGTSIWSNHASGLAIDLEAPSNGQGLLGYGSMPRTAGAIAKALGFGWGGYVGVGGTYSASFTDPMHFEYLGTPSQAAYTTSQLGTTGGVDMSPNDKVTTGRYAGWTWLQVWDYTASNSAGAKSLAEVTATRLAAVEATLTTVKQQTAT